MSYEVNEPILNSPLYEPSRYWFISLIPFLCKVAYNLPPGFAVTLSKVGLQGGLIMCIFIKNWYDAPYS
jgi:hypothetical protein